VIPAYNGESFIADALRSVFAQTRLPQEVVVVDDASTDHTTRRVEQQAARAPVRVRLIRLTRNSGGPAFPMNVGIQAARSPVIAVLDQDDVFLPQKLACQSAVLTANLDVNFVFGRFELMKSEPSARPADRCRNACQGGFLATSERQQRPLHRQMTGPEKVLYCNADVALRVLLQRGNCVGGFPSFMFRRDDWRAIGGLDERLVAAADYDFLCRLCRGGRIAMFRDVHYRIRRHADNLSRNPILCCTDEMETLLKFDGCAAWPNAAGDVRQSVASHLYRLAVLLAGSGSAVLARQLLVQSLFVGRLHPRPVLRAVEYPLKVYRRRRRGRQPAVTSEDRDRVDCIMRRVTELFGGLEERRLLQQTAQLNGSGPLYCER
jgi:glycosyltransferase involved in cell wall biosynthesis